MSNEIVDEIKRLNKEIAQFVMHPSTYERIVDKLGEGLIVVDALGTIVLVNQEIELMFGYDRSQLLGKSVGVLLPPELTRQHEEHIKRFFKRPSTRPMNFARPLQGRHQNGDPVTVQISLAPVMDPNGILVVAIVKSVVDAT